jgi:hypothetical protein
MKKCLLCLFVAGSIHVQAQPGSKEEVLYNADIIGLSRDGLSKDIVKAKIQHTKTAFNLSGDSLLSLKKAGIGDDIILAMMSKGTPPAAHPAEKTFNLPPGFYYEAEGKLNPLEQGFLLYKPDKGIGGAVKKMAGAFVPLRIHAEAAHPTAAVHVTEESPVYYYICDSLLASNDPKSPGDFLLVKMSPKDGNREVSFKKPVLPPTASKTEATIQITGDQNIPFAFKRVSATVYEIKCRALLPPGEYGFMLSHLSAYTGHSYPIFDFGYSKK